MPRTGTSKLQWVLLVMQDCYYRIGNNYVVFPRRRIILVIRLHEENNEFVHAVPILCKMSKMAIIFLFNVHGTLYL